jgi:hypothetical protein
VIEALELVVNVGMEDAVLVMDDVFDVSGGGSACLSGGDSGTRITSSPEPSSGIGVVTFRLREDVLADVDEDVEGGGGSDCAASWGVDGTGVAPLDFGAVLVLRGRDRVEDRIEGRGSGLRILLHETLSP